MWGGGNNPRDERGAGGPVLRDPMAASSAMSRPKPYNNFGNDRRGRGRGGGGGGGGRGGAFSGANNFNTNRQAWGDDSDSARYNGNHQSQVWGNQNQQQQQIWGGGGGAQEQCESNFPPALEEAQFPPPAMPFFEQQQQQNKQTRLLEPPPPPLPPPLIPQALFQNQDMASFFNQNQGQGQPPMMYGQDFSAMFQLQPPPVPPPPQPPSLLQQELQPPPPPPAYQQQPPSLFQQPTITHQFQFLQDQSQSAEPAAAPASLMSLQLTGQGNSQSQPFSNNSTAQPPLFSTNSSTTDFQYQNTDFESSWYSGSRASAVPRKGNANENQNRVSRDREQEARKMTWELPKSNEFETNDNDNEPDPYEGRYELEDNSPWFAEFVPQEKKSTRGKNALDTWLDMKSDEIRSMTPNSRPPAPKPVPEFVANPLNPLFKFTSGAAASPGFNKAGQGPNSFNQRDNNNQSQRIERNPWPSSSFNDRSQSGGNIPPLLPLPGNNKPVSTFRNTDDGFNNSPNPFYSKNNEQLLSPKNSGNRFDSSPTIARGPFYNKNNNAPVSALKNDGGGDRFNDMPNPFFSQNQNQQRNYQGPNQNTMNSRNNNFGGGNDGAFNSQAFNTQSSFGAGRQQQQQQSNVTNRLMNLAGVTRGGRGGRGGGGRGRGGGQVNQERNLTPVPRLSMNGNDNTQNQNNRKNGPLLPTPKLIPYPPPPPAKPVERNPRGILKPTTKYSNFVEGGLANNYYSPEKKTVVSYDDDDDDDEEIEYLGDHAGKSSGTQSDDRHDFFSEKMVQHYALLLKGKSVEDQLEGLMSYILLAPEFLATRVAIVRNLHVMLSEKYHKCVLHPYGADFIGVGNSDDSVNIFVDLTGKQGSTTSITSANIEPSELTKEAVDELLQHIQTGENHSFFGQIVKRTNFGRINLPVISFIHCDSKVRCNIRLENYFLVQEAKMIQFVSTLDTRIRPLLGITRYWSSVHRVLDTPEEDTRNRFITMLVLFFLARKKIVPTMAHLYSLSVKREYFENVDIAFCDDYGLVPQNENSVLEDKNIFTLSTLSLLKEFFTLFATANLKEEVVCLWNGEFIPKENFSPDVELKMLPPDLRKRYRYGANGKLRERRLDCSSRLCIQDFQDLTENLSIAIPEYDVSKFQYECDAAKVRLENMMISGLGTLTDLFVVTDYTGTTAAK